MAEVAMTLLHWKVVDPFDHYVNQLKSVNIWQKIRSKLTCHLRKIKHLWPVKISDSSFSMWILFFIPWKLCQRWYIIKKDYSIIKMFLPYKNDRGDC